MRNSTPTIALVENDIATSVALRRLLRAQGFAVQVYHSGESYLGRTGCVGIDCLLLDINLDGMSGLELQRKIRSSQRAVPIIFMTGRDDAHTEACAREQGCSGYLHKPFEARLLTEAIETALHAGSSGAERRD